MFLLDCEVVSDEVATDVDEEAISYFVIEDTTDGRGRKVDTVRKEVVEEKREMAIDRRTRV